MVVNQRNIFYAQNDVWKAAHPGSLSPMIQIGTCVIYLAVITATMTESLYFDGLFVGNVGMNSSLYFNPFFWTL